MSESFQVIDLSRTLRPSGPESSALPRFATWWYARREWGDVVNFQAMLISEHTGTNVDAPKHVLDEGETIDQLPVDAFFGPAVTLDVSHLEPQAEITSQVLETAEAASTAEIRTGDILLLMTKHDERHWEDRPKGYAKLKNRPALTLEAAEYIAAKGVKAVGVDTVSPDVSGTPLPVHHYLLERGILIIEALSNLDQVPPGRFLFVALPLKIQNGSGSPVRAVAITGDLSSLLEP
jgi:kynurenine formamidase